MTSETNQPKPETSPTPGQSLLPQIEEPAFGWTPYAERINGRFAMIGFVALLVIEIITGEDFFTWLGLR